mgnify:FL=1
MSRRANGEGCIVKTASGKWSARIQIGFNSNGKPKIKTFSADTRKAVTERLNIYIRESKITSDSNNKYITVSAGIRVWLETYKKLYLKSTSYDRLETTINSNIVPYIGHMNTCELTASVIQERLINALYLKGLSYSTIKKAYNALNGYLRQCEFDGSILKNPMIGVRLPFQNQFKKDEITTLTEAEMERFCSAAVDRFKSSGGLITRNGYAYIMVLYTGLRLSEALSLKWTDVDFSNKCIYINKNAVSVKDRDANHSSAYKVIVQNSTKTASGIREVPLCFKAFDALLAHKGLYHAKNNDYLFTSRNGNLVTPRNFAKSLSGIYNRAGINKSGAHILRHTFASMLFEKGVDIKIISKLLGHSRVEITYNEYVHLFKAQEISAIDLLDQL